MKIKSITKEQYITLAQLGMPVYCHTMPLPRKYIFSCLTDEVVQSLEQARFIEYSQKYTKFVTLVDSE